MAARRARVRWVAFVYVLKHERATAERCTTEGLDRRVRLGAPFELDEREPAAGAGRAIDAERDVHDAEAARDEEVAQAVLARIRADVSHKEAATHGLDHRRSTHRCGFLAPVFAT